MQAGRDTGLESVSSTFSGRTSDVREQGGRPDVVVLLVDDQAIIGEAIRRAVESAPDIRFHYCGSAREARAEALRIRPTVILQDLVLPDIDGLSLVKAYRAEQALQDTPIIVLSTKEDPATKSAAFSQGANDYLVKVPDSVELIARLRYHSQLYVAMRQRDEAYRALRDSQQQLLESNLALRRLTQSDGLTGLANRRYFDEYLRDTWDEACESGRDFAVLMIDVDHFKAFNDTYGHLVGDEALKGVAGAIKSACVRASDLPARYGGEEFAAILPGTTAGGARLLGEKIRLAVLALNTPHSASSTAATLTVSVGGVSVRASRSLAPADVLRGADDRLYDAKRAGRNRVLV